MTQSTPTSPSPLKNAYRVFNRSVKKFIHYCRDVFPELESQIKSSLVVLKVTKVAGIKFVFKMYMELFDNPYRSYLDAKDTAFFISDGFVVKYVDDYVAKFKSSFRNCSETEREDIWRAAQEIFNARDQVLKCKAAGAGSDVESD